MLCLVCLGCVVVFWCVLFCSVVFVWRVVFRRSSTCVVVDPAHGRFCSTNKQRTHTQSKQTNNYTNKQTNKRTSAPTLPMSAVLTSPSRVMRARWGMPSTRKRSTRSADCFVCGFVGGGGVLEVVGGFGLRGFDSTVLSCAGGGHGVCACDGGSWGFVRVLAIPNPSRLSTHPRRLVAEKRVCCYP